MEVTPDSFYLILLGVTQQKFRQIFEIARKPNHSQ